MGHWAFRVLLAAGGIVLALLLTLAGSLPTTTSATAQSVPRPSHQGVASCSGSTCHGRQEATGAVVRQNELLTWQDESSPSGAHSRAWRVLKDARSVAIAARLGIGPAHEAPQCLGCHADPVPAGLRGPRFQLSDGIGCETCHGAASGWISSHTAVNVSHKDNVARGMRPLEQPKARAALCLDCHFNGNSQNRFVSHRMMAAGHPRLSFELDLFTNLQQHHDEDADYRRRKSVAGGVKVWAVGQAPGVGRTLGLYARTDRGQDGVFPELTFFDCRTCHRQFSDDPGYRASAPVNEGRPIASGIPAYNDENMLMLAAAVRAVLPGKAAMFERTSRDFHAAFMRDRATAASSALRLADLASQLGDDFDRAPFTRAQTFAILGELLSGPLARRYTDYQGGAQAGLAVVSLLSATAGRTPIERRALVAMRPDIDRAYALVRDANKWQPDAFRQTLARLDTSIRKLK